MRNILKNSKISLLLPQNNDGGLSKEVHLVNYNGQNYVLRRVKKLSQAREYEELSNLFEKQGFLPKLLGRFGKDVLYEYIPGRDLIVNESLSTIEQIGKIAGYINKVEAKADLSSRFYSQLNELTTGKFSFSDKELTRRLLNNVNKDPAPIFTISQADKIKSLYSHLKELSNPTVSLDANDIHPGNFRIDNSGKVYFVDVEAIKPRIKGFGIAKFYLQWGKSAQKRKAFNKGYKSVNSLDFLTPQYLDFLYLNFLVQKIDYNIKIHRIDYQKSLKQLNELLSKY